MKGINIAHLIQGMGRSPFIEISLVEKPEDERTGSSRLAIEVRADLTD
jgi:hypothetical protein